MKKLIVSFIALAAIATAAVSPVAEANLAVGYRSKDFTFGKVSSTEGAYVAGAEVKWQSFRLGTQIQNNMTLNSTGLYQIDLLGGYSFFSTLANVEVGTKYVTKYTQGVLDKANHWRPFVAVSKCWFSVTGTMDVESQTTNIEGKISDTGILWGTTKVKLIPALYAGYTDANDALPRSKKEIKYTNGYFGGSFDVSWWIFSAGIYTLRDGLTEKFTTGWRAGTAIRF